MLHLSTNDVCQVFAAAHHLQMTEVIAFVLLSSLYLIQISSILLLVKGERAFASKGVFTRNEIFSLKFGPKLSINLINNFSPFIMLNG